MKKHHYKWIIPGRIEICTLDGIPSINCIGPTALSDTQIVLKWEKEHGSEIENANTPEKYIDHMEKFKKFIRDNRDL